MKIGPFEITRKHARQPTVVPDETKASQVGGMLVSAPGVAQWSKRDYEAFAREGYMQNVVVATSIGKIADAIAQIPWDVIDAKGDKIEPETSPLWQLWAKPNPQMSRSEYLRAVVCYYKIAGNVYPEQVTGNKMPRELWLLRPDRTKVVPGFDGMTVGFEYRVGGKVMRIPITENEETVRHIKSFNPLDDFYGMSAIEPAARSIDQHNEAMAYIQSLLQNQATPKGGLKVPGDVRLGDDERARILAQLEQRYTGGVNGGRTMLLEGGLEWVEMGLSPSDLQVIETMHAAARNISLALGVPPQMIGIPGDSTYSNFQEARISFYEETVLPLLHLITQEHNDWLGRSFDGQQLTPDLEQVPALVDKKRQLWEMADASTDLTIDERRELKGYPPLPNKAGEVLAQAVPAGQQVNADLKSVQDRLAYG